MEDQLRLNSLSPAMEKPLATAALFPVFAWLAFAVDSAIKPAPHYVSPPQIYSWTGF
jgi:hypothetical protein